MSYSPDARARSSHPDVPGPRLRRRPPRLWALVLLGTVLARITHELESEPLRWSAGVLSLVGISVWCSRRFPPPRRWFVGLGTLLTLLLTLLFVRSAGVVALLSGTLIASGVVYGYAYLSTWLVRPPDAPAASPRTRAARRVALALPLLAQLVVLIVAGSYAERPATALDLVRRSNGIRQLIAFPAGTNSIDLSPDGTRAVSIAVPNTESDNPESAPGQTYPVSVWDVGTGTMIQTLHQPLHRFVFGNEVVLSQSGDLVAINNGAEIRVWQVDDGTLRYQLPLVDTLFSDLLFSPDASLLAVTDRKREREVVQLWSLRDGSLVRTLEMDAQSRSILDLAFSPDGQLLALHHGGTVTIWRVADGARQRTLETTWMAVGLTPSLAFSPDRQLLVVGGIGPFSPDGQSLVVGGRGTTDDQHTVAELWRVGDGVLLHTFRDTQTDADTFWYSAVAFSADGTRVMTTTGNGAETAEVALLFNVQDGRLLRRIDPAIGIRDLRFAPNDTEVLVTEWPYLFALQADGLAE